MNPLLNINANRFRDLARAGALWIELTVTNETRDQDTQVIGIRAYTRHRQLIPIPGATLDELTFNPDRMDMTQTAQDAFFTALDQPDGIYAFTLTNHRLTQIGTIEDDSTTYSPMYDRFLIAITLDGDALHRLAQMDIVDLQVAGILGNPALTTPTLDFLARHSVDPSALHPIATHPLTSSDTLDYIAQVAPHLNFAIANHHNTATNTLFRIAIHPPNSTYLPTHNAIAVHPNTHPDTLRYLHNEHPGTHNMLATNPHTPHDLLSHYATSPNTELHSRAQRTLDQLAQTPARHLN